MRHLSHHDALSRNAAVPPDGGGGTTAPSKLEFVRHGACRLPPQPDERGRSRLRIRVVLRDAFFTSVDLAAPSARRSGHSAVPRDVVPLQALELALARVDSTAADGARLAPDRGAHAPAPLTIPSAAGALDGRAACTDGGAGRRLIATRAITNR